MKRESGRLAAPWLLLRQSWFPCLALALGWDLVGDGRRNKRKILAWCAFVLAFSPVCLLLCVSESSEPSLCALAAPSVRPSSAHNACCSVCPQCSLCCWLCCSCPWLSCSGLGDADLVRGLQAPAGLTPFPLSLFKWCLMLNIFLFLTKTHLAQVSSFFLSHLNPSSSHSKPQVHSGTSGPFLDCLPAKCLTWLFYLLQTFPQMSPITLANNVTVIAPYSLTLFSPCSYLMHLISLIKKKD